MTLCGTIQKLHTIGGATSVEVEKSTNVNYASTYWILCGDYEYCGNDFEQLAIESWGDLDNIQDGLKVAAMMLHLEY